MAVYVYETTDPQRPVERFELRQSMKDEPLTIHPETGAAIRRVITGGFGYMAKAGSSPRTGMKTAAHSCGSGCRCC